MPRRQMAVICAAGAPGSWNEYLGTCRYLAPVHTGPLAQRTIDQLRARGVTDIVVTAADPRLKGLTGCRVARPRALPPCPHSAVAQSIEFWVPGKDAIVLNGDTYYSDGAIDKILAGPRNFVWWYGRTGGGSIEKGHYEMWGVVIPDGFQPVFREACEKACQASVNGSGATASSWLVYRILNGLQIAATRLIGPSWTELNDETEDFDFPEEWDAWVRMYPDFGPPEAEEEAPTHLTEEYIKGSYARSGEEPRDIPFRVPDARVEVPSPAPPPVVVEAEIEVDASQVPAEPGSSLEEEARQEKNDGGQPPEDDTQAGVS